MAEILLIRRQTLYNQSFIINFPEHLNKEAPSSLYITVCVSTLLWYNILFIFCEVFIVNIEPVYNV